MLHGKTQARSFLFNEERHKIQATTGQNMMEGEKEKKKKKGKTGLNQIFSQTKVN